MVKQKIENCSEQELKDLLKEVQAEHQKLVMAEAEVKEESLRQKYHQ